MRDGLDLFHFCNDGFYVDSAEMLPPDGYITLSYYLFRASSLHLLHPDWIMYAFGLTWTNSLILVSRRLEHNGEMPFRVHPRDHSG